MQASSSSSACCSRRWCRAPRDDQADTYTWMEPCRSSKSKRRQSENGTAAATSNNDASEATTSPLLGGNDGSASQSQDDERGLMQNDSAVTNRPSSCSNPESSENRVSSSFLDATTQINNCSGSNKAGSSKWRYLFSSSKQQRPIIDTTDILGKETVKGLRGALPSPPRGVLDDVKNKFIKSPKDDNSTSIMAKRPVTCIMALENGLFVTASKSDKNMKLWKLNNISQEKKDSEDDIQNDIEFICDFKGHVSGVTAMIKLDKRGRFLTASLDKAVKLWEIDCDKDDVKDGPNLLATFTKLDKRWIKSMVPLDEGAFVRPTDGISVSMVKAMATKTAFEGAASVHQAALDRTIVQCSGAFATSSQNGKTIKVWEMSLLDSNNDDSAMRNNVSKVCLMQELQHDAVIEAVEVAEDGSNILAGDVMGDIYLWSKPTGILSGLRVTKSKQWELIQKFTWRGDKRVHTEEIFQHSITSLCFLDGVQFVSGTKEGVVQIWDGTDMCKPQTVRVAEKPVSRIQKVSINEPNVEGFVVCCEGGRVLALTVKTEGGNVTELDAFPLNCTKVDGDGESCVITMMEAISLPYSNKKSVSLIVGDENGAAYLSQSELA